MKKNNKFLVLFLLAGIIALASQAQAATETLYPNAAGDLTQHTPSVSYANWQCVSDYLAVDTNTIVQVSGTSDFYDLYNIPSPSSAVTNSIINSVTIYIKSIGVGSGTKYAAPYIELDNDPVKRYGGDLNTLTGSYALYSTAWATRPSDNLSWTYNDLVNLQIGVHSKGTASGPSSVEITTLVYAVIDYSPLDHFALALASPQTNGAAFSGVNTLTAQDASGNTITTFDASTNNVTLTSNPADGTISGLGSGSNNVLNQATDFASGVANLTSLGIKFTGTAGSHTFIATSVDNNTGTSGTVTVNAGTAAKLGMKTQPSGGTAAVAWTTQPAIYIQDANDNTVTGDNTTTVTATIGTNPNSGTLSGTTTATASSGVATFTNLNIDKFGTGYTLSFTSSPALTSVTSSAFDINAAAGSCGDIDGDGLLETTCACGNTVVGASGYAYQLTGDLNCTTSSALTVNADLNLNADINTTGHGLIIGASGIIIDGNSHIITGDGGSSDYGINDSGGYDNITIQNFGTSANSGISNFHNGIYLSGSTGSKILNNIANSNTNTGIYLSSSSSGTLTGNTANLNFTGIFLTSSGTSTTLTDNNVNSSSIGIYLINSGGATMTGNTMSGNNSNLYVTGGPGLGPYDNNINTTNLVEGKPVLYLYGTADNNYHFGKIYSGDTNDAGGAGVQYAGPIGTFWCILCNNVTVKNATLSRNTYGVYFQNSSDSNITNITANSNNYYGIFLSTSPNSTLTGNTANSNDWDGINLSSSGSSTLTNNTANLNNKTGIYLSSSASSTLTNNTMSMNTKDFYDNQAASNTYQNNQSLHNATSTMISFAETSTTGIKNLNDTISFTVTAKKPDSNACANCTVITVSPSESSLSYSDNGSGVVTGSFTPTRTGTYSLGIKVTDSNSNVAERNYSFLVDTAIASIQTTKTTYYYRGINPTHGQPAGRDAKSLLLTAPTSTEEGVVPLGFRILRMSFPIIPLPIFLQ